MGPDGSLHSIFGSSCFTDWASSTSSIPVARLMHPHFHVLRPSTCPLLAVVSPCLPQPMTNSGPSPVSTASGATRSSGLSCTLVRLTEWWDCAMSANNIVALVHRIFPVTSLTTQRRPAHQHQSLRPIKLPHLTRLLVRLPWSSPALPADGCGYFGCTSPRVPCWIPLSHSRSSFLDGGRDLR